MKNEKGGPNWTPRPSLPQAYHGPHEPPNLLHLVGLGEAQVSWEIMAMVSWSSML
jgi:hypothetical protein